MSQRTESQERTATHQFTVQVTANSTDQEYTFFSVGRGEDYLKRFLGFALLVNMPGDGLLEALTSLKEIWEFYLENLQYRLPEPDVIRTGIATVATVSESPDLVISE